MFYHIKCITGDCLRTCCLPGAPQSAQRLLSGCFTSSSKIFLFRSRFDISARSRGLLSHDTESRRRYRTCWSHGFVQFEMKAHQTGTSLLCNVRNTDWQVTLGLTLHAQVCTVHWQRRNVAQVIYSSTILLCILLSSFHAIALALTLYNFILQIL